MGRIQNVWLVTGFPFKLSSQYFILSIQTWNQHRQGCVFQLILPVFHWNFQSKIYALAALLIEVLAPFVRRVLIIELHEPNVKNSGR